MVEEARNLVRTSKHCLPFTVYPTTCGELWTKSKVPETKVRSRWGGLLFFTSETWVETRLWTNASGPQCCCRPWDAPGDQGPELVPSQWPALDPENCSLPSAASDWNHTISTAVPHIWLLTRHLLRLYYMLASGFRWRVVSSGGQHWTLCYKSFLEAV